LAVSAAEKQWHAQRFARRRIRNHDIGSRLPRSFEEQMRSQHTMLQKKILKPTPFMPQAVFTFTPNSTRVEPNGWATTWCTTTSGGNGHTHWGVYSNNHGCEWDSSTINKRFRAETPNLS
jgi:hypothetical protein